MFNPIALLVRLIFLVLIAMSAVAIALFFGRKRLKKWEKTAVCIMAAILLLLGGAGTLKSLISPELKTVEATFKSESRGIGLSPFQMEYCFESGGEKIYLDLDAISKNVVFKGEFVKNEKYTVTFEIDSNLIVAVSKKD